MSTEIVKTQKAVTFNYFDSEQFATMQRLCTMFASSELVPKMYQISTDNPKEKAIANCMIAVEIAHRIGASPLMVMQNMTPIYGKPSWSAKFLIATVNACGRFNPMEYRVTNLGPIKNIEYTEHVWNSDARKKVPVKKVFEGPIDNWECVAYTTEKGDDKIKESIPVSIEMAIKEGWYTKDGSKWKTMPQLMLRYRAATYWTSTFAPELSMGIKTTEELHDIEDIPYVDVSDRVKTEVSENANKGEMGMDDEPEQDPQTEKKPEPEPEKRNPNF